jgi:hypothetical protein
MDESDWRALAQLAIDELDVLISDDEVRQQLRADLSAALARPEGTATETIRALLTGNSALRDWLDAKMNGDGLLSAADDAEAGPGVEESPDFGVDSGFESTDEVLLGGGGNESVEAENEAPPAELLERSWLVAVKDYDESTGLTVGAEHVVDLGVGTDPTGATVVAKLDEIFEDVFKAHPGVMNFDLTVQAASEDFDIVSDQAQTLTLPRTGPSVGKVSWRVIPKHAGACLLVATVSYQGNFLTELDLTLPAGEPGPVHLDSRGRAPDSVVSLERKNLGLFIRQTIGSGYDLTVDGDIRGVTRLPITPDELAFVVDDIQKALFEVVSTTNAEGVPVFQKGLDIPQEMSDAALVTLAKAGAFLFNQLFFHPAASQDLQNVGTWLRENATKPNVELAFEVMAENAPIPWPMLYCGDTADGVELTWNNFIGMRHVLHSIPIPPNLEVRDVKIVSQPQLSVGLNVDTTIDDQFGVTWVAEHQTRWADEATKRQHLVLLPRSTKASVVAALDDTLATDQIVYFLCHATSVGKDGNPADATLNLGRGGPIVLRDLQAVVPRTRFTGRPLVFINACESADLSPRFYAGFVPYFVSKGARGVIGTECKVPVVLAVEFADRFFERLLDGATVGESVLKVRRQLLDDHRNPLGLVYGVHCDSGTRVDPALAAV